MTCKIGSLFFASPSPSGRGCREAAGEGKPRLNRALIRPFAPPSPGGRRTLRVPGRYSGQLLQFIHKYFVRNFFFSACLSRASAIRRSISSPYGTPVASHNFGNMLIDVKPGSVLISLTKNLPVVLSRKRSARASPEHSRAWKARMASCRASRV